jgi:TRAM domain
VRPDHSAPGGVRRAAVIDGGLSPDNRIGGVAAPRSPVPSLTLSAPTAQDWGRVRPSRRASVVRQPPWDPIEKGLCVDETRVGSEIEVLVEERNRRGQLTGKSRGNTTVVLEGPDALIGELLPVRVTCVTGTTMIGQTAGRSAVAR